jgi:hypothetical protein
MDGACGTLGAGEPCDPNASACDEDENLVCDLMSKTCTKAVDPQPTGCPTTPCPPDEYCEETSGGAVCRKEVPVGGACDGAHFLCVSPGWCNAGRCTTEPITCE